MFVMSFNLLFIPSDILTPNVAAAPNRIVPPETIALAIPVMRVFTDSTADFERADKEVVIATVNVDILTATLELQATIFGPVAVNFSKDAANFVNPSPILLQASPIACIA